MGYTQASPITCTDWCCRELYERQRQRRRQTATPSPLAETMDRRGYRIEEAARYMGVTPWFVELKVRSGELRALRMCRHYTILKEDMDAFLDAQWAA
jgi:excisionase family DNA binding protein